MPAISMEPDPEQPETGQSSADASKPVVNKDAVRERLEALTKDFETPVRVGASQRVSLGTEWPQHYSSADLKKAAEKKINWQVENLWTLNSKLLLASEPKAGKTYFVCSIAVAMASGQLLWDKFKVMEPCPVGIIAAEDDEGETGRRLDRMCRAQGLMLSQLPIHWWPADAIRVNRPRDVDWIRKQIREYGIKLMVYDPLARLMDGDENSKECVSGVLTPASSITRPQNEGCSVMIVHHLGKDNPDQPKTAAQRVRGSSDIRSWYTTGIFLSGKLGNGRVAVELEQRVQGNAPTDFPVRAVEVEEQSTYGLGTMRLVANISKKDPNDFTGNNEQMVETAADRILDLISRKGKGGVTLSEISVHLGLGKTMVNCALKKLIREQQLIEFEDAKDIPDGKVLVAREGAEDMLRKRELALQAAEARAAKKRKEMAAQPALPIEGKTSTSLQDNDVGDPMEGDGPENDTFEPDEFS